MKDDETKEGRMGEEKDEKQQMLGWFLFIFCLNFIWTRLIWNFQWLGITVSNDVPHTWKS